MLEARVDVRKVPGTAHIYFGGTTVHTVHCVLSAGQYVQFGLQAAGSYTAATWYSAAPLTEGKEHKS